MANCGVTTDEAVEAIIAFNKLLPPVVEEDIELIKRNPNLTWWQKRKLIHMIKRDIN